MKRRPGQHGPAQPWSDAEFTHLLRMLDLNYRPSVMAKLLGRSVSSVKGKIERHGLKRVRPKRTRSVQINLTEEEYTKLKHEAGSIPLFAYFRSLLLRDPTTYNRERREVGRK